MEFAWDSFELGNIWREVHRELKLKELWMEKKSVKEGKRTLKTSITKLLNELAAELSTKTPNKENVTAKIQNNDKRREELLELLDSFQTFYGDNKHASLAASTGAEADKMIDRVDNETKEARLFLSQSNSKGSEGNNTSQIGRTWQRWSRGRCKQTARADSNPKVFGRQERISVVVGSVFQLCG